MDSDSETNIDFPRTNSQESGQRRNPAEDLSEHGRCGEEPVVFGPDGNGESPEMDDLPQIGRGAD